jgi:hypothetical protein
LVSSNFQWQLAWHGGNVSVFWDSLPDASSSAPSMAIHGFRRSSITCSA